MNQKWPGINAKWKSAWKAQYKNQLGWFEHFYPSIKDELEHYGQRQLSWPVNDNYLGRSVI